MEGLTFEQLQAMGAKPVETPQSGGLTLEQLQTMGAKEVVRPVARQGIEIKKRPLFQRVSNFIADNISGGGDVARGLGGAIGLSQGVRSIESSIGKQNEVMTGLINQIRDKRARGEDVSSLLDTLAQQGESIRQTGQGAVDIAEELPTNKDVIGSAVQLGALPLGGAIQSKVASKIASPVAKGIFSGMAGGATDVALFNVGDAIAQGEDPVKAGIKGLATGALVGGVLGTALGSPAIARNLKSKLFPTANIDELAGRILQPAKGKTRQATQIIKSLRNTDLSSVRNFEDAAEIAGAKKNLLIEQVDDILSQDQTLRNLDELAVRQATRTGEVATNYVERSIEDLVKYYKATGDDVAVANISDLLKRATNEGITAKEVNDLAREYGRVFSPRSFKTNGDLMNSIGATAWESNRKGIKETARNLMPNAGLKELDKEISNLIQAEERFSQLNELANVAKNKLQQLPLGGKIASSILNILDTISFGGIQGIASQLRKQSGIAGKKFDDILQLEKTLQKNFGKLQEALEVIDAVPVERLNSLLETKLFQDIFDTDSALKDIIDAAKKNLNDPRNARGGFLNIGAILGDVSDDIIQEARKYKSAEEFIKAQGTPVYHGGTEIKEVGNMRSKWGAFYMTDNPTYAKSYGGNKSFLNEMVITTEAKLADLRKPSSDIVKQIEDIISPKKTGKTFKIQKPDGSFIEVPETKGGLSNPVHSSADIIQGIKDGKAYYAEMPEVKKALKKLGYDGMITQESKFGANYGVWNKNVIKTKSQLEEIWKEANNK